MVKLRRGKLCLALLSAMSVLTGCAPKPIKAANKQKAPPPALPKGVVGEGITVNWLENLPDGNVRHVLDIKAETGSATTGTRSGVFNKATGIVYQDGKPVARFTAPRVTAVEEKQTVTATGRVKAVSIDPPGVTVEADRVTWLFAKKKILAEGRVMVHYKRPGQSRMTAEIPLDHAVLDTELKSFDTELHGLQLP